jgi:spore coat polysaccharide biosynthesis predicted glycosyltransferase SpsG
MRVSIRTTASAQIGYGHLRRCRTLADALERRGAEVTFLLTGTAPALFTGNVQMVREDTLDEVASRAADLVLLDDYALSDAHFAALRAMVRCPLAAIDDPMERRCDAIDVLVNPSAGVTPDRYGAKTLLLGPRYALLRDSFVDLPPRTVNERVEHVFITLGGADPCSDMPAVLQGVRAAVPAARIEVLLGPLFHAANVTAVETFAQLDGKIALHQSADVAKLMRAADLALSTGGQTLFELAATGTPTIALEVADNQRHNIDSLAVEGTLVRTTRETIAKDVAALASDREQRQAMARRGQRLVDGEGKERVAEALVRAARA